MLHLLLGDIPHGGQERGPRLQLCLGEGGTHGESKFALIGEYTWEKQMITEMKTTFGKNFMFIFVMSDTNLYIMKNEKKI